MRYLLIYRVNISDLSHSGALIKMESQKRALEKIGHTVSLINHDSKHIFLDQKPIANISITGVWGRYWYNFKSFFQALMSIDLSSYDCVYIRYPFSNPAFLSFCKTIKRQNPACKIIIEMPTFPYNREFKGLAKFYTIIDNIYRKQLNTYVDYVVHFGLEKRLLGIPSITSTNGIDLDKFPLRTGRRSDKHIRLIAVGKWSYWHGIDRLLLGLKDYYSLKDQEYNIDVTIVGEGTDLGKLRKSVDPSIREKVCFVGILRGKELDAVFNQGDIGVGTIGIHRKGLKYNASLKHREYCARGLPFILSTRDMAFSKDLSFVHYVSEDDTPINMKEVIALYERQNDRHEIRAFAEKNLNWEKIMEEVTKVVTEKRGSVE